MATQAMERNLKRAIQTAEAINRYHSMKIKVDEAWREREAGVYVDADMWRDLFDFSKNIKLDGMEPLNDFFERVSVAIDKLKNEHADQSVFVVSHGGTQYVLHACANKLPLSGSIIASPIKNCEFRQYNI
ncbi:MAG: histidine phosphatase family protein [Candidatus Woesebacteria bacterium]|jgi:broad specificity phosphatase PhoE